MYPDFCQHCDKKATDETVTLARCSHCKVVSYCSITCQKADWKAGHREQCPELIAEMEEEEEPANDMNLPEPIWEMLKSKMGPKRIVPLPKRDPNVTYTQEDVDEIIEQTIVKNERAQGRRVIGAFWSSSKVKARSKPASSGVSRFASSGIGWLPNLSGKPPVPSPPVGLSAGIFKPFHRLDEETWLHGRAEEDVYRILIDVYRSRIKDQYEGENGDDPTATPVPLTPVKDFKAFLNLFDKNNKRALLPEWWTAEKAEECVNFALRGDDSDDAWISLVRFPTR